MGLGGGEGGAEFSIAVLHVLPPFAGPKPEAMAPSNAADATSRSRRIEPAGRARTLESSWFMQLQASDVAKVLAVERVKRQAVVQSRRGNEGVGEAEPMAERIAHQQLTC